MNIEAAMSLVFGVVGGVMMGLYVGWKIWGPKWFDTSEGIDRRFRKQMRRGF